jgi:hypothetical protein
MCDALLWSRDWRTVNGVPRLPTRGPGPVRKPRAPRVCCVGHTYAQLYYSHAYQRLQPAILVAMTGLYDRTRVQLSDGDMCEDSRLALRDG